VGAALCVLVTLAGWWLRVVHVGSVQRVVAKVEPRRAQETGRAPGTFGRSAVAGLARAATLALAESPLHAGHFTLVLKRARLLAITRVVCWCLPALASPTLLRSFEPADDTPLGSSCPTSGWAGR
jgi:hypothetical protein